MKLWELFETKWAEFQKETLKIRGKDAIVEYDSENLLWGKGLYQKLRIVLVREGESRFILFSTDLSIDSSDILSLYLRRSRTEGAFRELKQGSYAANTRRGDISNGPPTKAILRA